MQARGPVILSTSKRLPNSVNAPQSSDSASPLSTVDLFYKLYCVQYQTYDNRPELRMVDKDHKISSADSSDREGVRRAILGIQQIPDSVIGKL